MNEKIIQKFQEKQCSVYAMSKQTGLAYTTLSEIFNGKINVNKCAAETVYKLMLYFDCEMEDILNPIPLVVNVSGHYRGIRYKWISESGGTIALMIQDHKENKVIDTGNHYTQQRFYKTYRLFAELLIDAYLVKKKRRRY